MRAALLVLVLGGVAFASPPSLLLEGRLAWTLPAATPTLSSTVGLRWTLAGWEWVGKAEFAAGTWTTSTFSGTGKLGEIELSPTLSLDPQGPGFRALTVPGKLDLLGLPAEVVVRLEGKGLGWGLAFRGPKDGLVEEVRLRFNLKRFLDEVASDTFAPGFSSGEVRFRVALPCCVDRLRGWFVFTKAGFSELGLSFPLPFPPETGLLASGVVRLSVDKKSLSVGPGMIYHLPPCVEAFLALDWDSSTGTIRGIKVYAVGFRCRLGEFTVRGLTTFEPIGLVKAPYREALGITWEGGGCLGPAKFTSTLYFGDGGMFGLGEVELGAEIALGQGLALGLGAELPAAGSPRLTLRWRASL
ncbi:MAG: hypothetical protein N2320_03460 [Candidatus Bipolaricaulota bacterium]|nr:hypothetical protein [Candidatus Bipolaricaulota bacterium]